MNDKGFTLKKFLFGKISRKLILGFLIVALLVGIVGYFAFNAIEQASSLYRNLGGNFAPFTKSATDITSFSKRAESHLMLYLTLGNETDRDKFFSRIDSLNEEIAAIETLVATQEDKEAINTLKSQSADILKYGGILLREYDKDPQSFNLKGHEELVRNFYSSTSGARKSGVELAKIKRDLFLNQLAIDANTDITSFSKRAEGHLMLYLTLGNETDRDKFFSRHRSLENSINNLEKTIKTIEDRMIADKLESQSADILKYGEILLREYDKDPQSFNLKDHEEMVRNFYKSTNGARKSGVELAKIKTDEIESKIGAVNKRITGIKRDMVLLIMLMLVLIIILGISISLLISKPIRQLHEATEEVEKGNLKARVDIRTGDELEQLGNAFNRTTEALDRMKEEHHEIDKAKTEFLSITSHELRSPMTPMKAQLQMLIQGYFGKLSARQKEALDIILRNTVRLDRIIMDFLEISRIEAARLKFSFVKTDLTKHIRSLIEEMKAFMLEKNIDIVSNIGKLPIIEADPDRVMQVLRNLINNAIKFSEKNKKVEVAVKLEGDHILFSIKDYGIGIKPEYRLRVFEPFFQTEQTMYRKYRGTGLGLAICKGMVESQNGKIWVESKVGKGSTFYFTVPLTPVKETKPIRVLFSPKEGIEKKIRELFDEILGPVGSTEFEELKNRNALTRHGLFEYITSLMKQGVLEKEKEKVFKSKINTIFGEEVKEAGETAKAE